MTGVRRANLVTLLVLVGVVAGMGGLAYASVPLYRLFCQVTGYGGTTQRADDAAAGESVPVGDRVITVRFDSNVSPRLPWTFRPEQRAIDVRVGEEGLAFYSARNNADVPVTGQATFNVTPLKAGVYFVKVACFCFEEQTLAAGQRADMPVSFFIDPAIADDRNLDEVGTITLSYTFFRADGDADPGAIIAADSGLSGERGE
jgi:cytochrome c oxidase assembly protein subunit 11